MQNVAGQKKVVMSLQNHHLASESRPGNNNITLISKVKSLEARIKDLGAVSVLPDYFVDRFVKVGSIDGFFEALRNKGLEGGGGSIRGTVQNEAKGGNAVNLGYALGRLGGRVNLFAIADGLPAEMLRGTLSKVANVNLHLIKGRCGFTIAIEFNQNGRLVNAMVSDTGDLDRFDGTKINRWDAIRSSRIVAVLNWAANKCGTDLCERVYSFAREHGIMTFFDPADLSELAYLLPEFKKRILERGLVDIISMNDNEARIMCRELGARRIPQSYDLMDLKQATSDLSQISGAVVDLHTRNFSLSAKSREVCSVPCHKVEQKIVTGAGDCWDAADIAGHLAEWQPSDRLAFANAAAGLYVSQEVASPPSLKEVCDFLKMKNL
ncbi:MAG TPA: carbohydrate kinase family protein [Nitrososphaerales archaeon]|nr:carbohydrate kinase family protein [Nitrososphaerales archaeon]